MEEVRNEENDQHEGVEMPISYDWTEFVGRHKNFRFTDLSGLQHDL